MTSQNKRDGQGKRGLVWASLIGLVLVLGVVAVIATGGSDDGDADSDVAQTRPVEVDGDALPVADDPMDDPAAGQPMPQIEGSSFDGEPVAITDDGTAKVILFLAHWCPHCQREVPVVDDWVEENGMPDDVALYSVATATSADRPNYPPSEWLDRRSWPLPVLVDDAAGSAAQAAGLSGFPFFVAVDADGEVVARASGGIGAEGLEQLIELARTGASS